MVKSTKENKVSIYCRMGNYLENDRKKNMKLQLKEKMSNIYNSYHNNFFKYLKNYGDYTYYNK